MRGLNARYPQLAYVPSEVRFQGRLAGRLAVVGADIPIEGSLGVYHLKTSLGDNWAALETTLIWLSRVFLRTHGSLPSCLSFYPLPETFGYRKKHATCEVARASAKRSRDAFVPLMAMTSMAISMYSANLLGYEPAWVSYIIEHGGLSHDWLDMIRDSQIADFKIPRVGTVVIAQTGPWIRWIERMELAGVPVWLCWGRDNGFLNSHPDLTPWIPTEQEIHKHHAAKHAIRYQAYDDLASSSLPPPPAIPPPNPKSRQRHGETWSQFFERRAAYNRKVDLMSTPQQLKERQQRVNEQSKYNKPGKRGPRVYQWADVNGFLLRTAVNRGLVESIWDNYTRSQMIYDPVLNEWDLCTALDPNAYAPDADDGWYEGLEDPAPDPVRPGDADVVDVDSVDISTYKPVTTEETLDRILFNRFGFCWFDEFAVLYPGPVADADWSKLVKLVADNDTAIHKKKKPAVVAFIKSFHDSSSTIPPLMWDLHPDCTKRINSSTFRIASIHWTDEDEDVYVVGDGGDWRLTVCDPLAVLECARRTLGPDSLSIARYLISKGMSLNTWTPLPPRVPPPRHRAPVRLGFRPASFKPVLADYVAYEERRNAFLSTPRARAALLMGGILWRLCKDVIPTDLALLGPSEDALSFGVYKCSGESLWYDDALTDDELDLICGVYTVAKGHFQLDRPLDQTTDMSWWPKPATWARSSLNVGYWASSCEEWFKRRLDRIQEGTADVKTSAQWTSALRILGKAAKLTDVHRTHARDFLLDVL